MTPYPTFADYLAEKTAKGEGARSRSEYFEARRNLESNSLGPGNRFNALMRRIWGEGASQGVFHEVNLAADALDPSAKFRRLDSYVLNQSTGKGKFILSRKAVDFDGIGETTFRNHLKEFRDKYYRGRQINSSKVTGTLDGHYVLEVPSSNYLDGSSWQQFEQIARSEGVFIRYVDQSTGTPVRTSSEIIDSTTNSVVRFVDID